MDGNRQGVGEEKRTFADEVKICMPAERGSPIDLTREKKPAQGVAWFEFSYCHAEGTTGYAGGMEGSFLSTP
jgi:hypothetical protein